MRRIQMRELALAAAEEQLLRGGYRYLNMDEVAAKSGMSKRTLYQLFPSKEELASRVLDSLLLRVVSEAAPEGTELTETDPITRFQSTVLAAEAALRRLPPELMEEFRLHAPYLHQKLAQFYEQRHRLITQLIREGQEAALIRSDLQPEFVAQIWLAAISTAISAQGPAWSQGPAEERVEPLLSLILDGLRIR